MGSGRCSEREHVGRKPMKANPALNVVACGQPGWLQVARLAAGASGDDARRRAQGAWTALVAS